METINDEIQPNSEAPADSAQKQTKRVFIGFAATVTIGLALAGWYVGGRILAAEKIHPVAVIVKAVEASPVSKAAAAVPVIAEPVASAPEQPKPVDAAPVWNTVDPQSGELYLQLAAMGPNSTNDYLKMLQAKGIHPRIAPGPSENLHRIVIGPYSDQPALEKEQKDLEAAGVQSMARHY
jgi:cell division septation protein DedD